MHIRSHSNLPRFIIKGNPRADKLANPTWVALQPDKIVQVNVLHDFPSKCTHFAGAVPVNAN